MSEWRNIKLKELCKRVTVGHVSSMADHYQDHGIPFLRSLNIKPYYLDLAEVKFIGEEFHNKLRKSALHPGDVVVVRTGYPGTAAVIPQSLSVANCSDLVIVRTGKELNPHFITAVFNSAFGQTLVSGNTVGAAQQHFNITVAKELRFRIPQRPIQDKIAAILTAYGDLVENNKRRIALLEKLAEEIYCEWFIRLRFPGYQSVKVHRGLPDGWQRKPLPELADITYGFPFDGSRFNSEGRGKAIIRIRNIPDSSTTDYTEEEAKDKYIVRTGELLVGMDGEFHINHWYGDEAYLVQRVCKLKAKNPLFEGYLAQAIRAPIKHYESILMGATVGHLGAAHLKNTFLISPPENLQERLQVFNEIYRQKLLLARAIRMLSKTRDQLLPRLISGKLSVDNLDIQLRPGVAEEINVEPMAIAHA